MFLTKAISYYRRTAAARRAASEAGWRRLWRTVGLNSKKQPKMRFLKIVKLTGYPYAYKILTNLEA